jgi:hypothetical protein
VGSTGPEQGDEAKFALAGINLNDNHRKSPKNNGRYLRIAEHCSENTSAVVNCERTQMLRRGRF